MKDWKSIKVKGELMKDIEGIIEGSNTSRIGFATAAIKKEIERIKKERYELDIQELVDEFRNNAVPYSKKGIKNLNDFASQLRTNSENIKKLEKKIEEFGMTTRIVQGAVKQGVMKVETTDTGTTIRMATPKEMKILKEKGVIKEYQGKTKRSRKSS